MRKVRSAPHQQDRNRKPNRRSNPPKTNSSPAAIVASRFSDAFRKFIGKDIAVLRLYDAAGLSRMARHEGKYRK